MCQVMFFVLFQIYPQRVREKQESPITLLPWKIKRCGSCWFWYIATHNVGTVNKNQMLYQEFRRRWKEKGACKRTIKERKEISAASFRSFVRRPVSCATGKEYQRVQHIDKFNYLFYIRVRWNWHLGLWQWSEWHRWP